MLMTFTDAPRSLIFTYLVMILYSDKDLKDLETVVNEELIKVGDWLDANKLSLNTSKSNFAIFHPYQNKPDCKIQLKIYNKGLKNSVPLEQKTFVKYLGIGVVAKTMTTKLTRNVYGGTSVRPKKHFNLMTWDA